MTVSEILMALASLVMYSILIYWAFCFHWSAGVFVSAFLVFGAAYHWSK